MTVHCNQQYETLREKTYQEISDRAMLPENPMVSVFMITYNQENFIARAIESVLSQKTNYTYELIIGEDCSTDRTREIVLSYANKYPEKIKVIYSQNNVGFHKNFYRTIKECKGKYIAFCEGDDFWHREDKLQIQVDFLEAEPDYGLVFTDHNRIFENYAVEINCFYTTTENKPPSDLNVFEGWNNYNILTCTVLARGDLIHTILEDECIYNNENYIGGVDIPLFIEISMLSKIHYIDESFSTYRVFSESASHFKDYARQTLFIKSVLGAYWYLAKKYEKENDERVAFEKYVQSSINAAFWNKDINITHEYTNIKPLSLKNKLLVFSIKFYPLSCLLRLILRVKYSFIKYRSNRKLFRHSC